MLTLSGLKNLELEKILKAGFLPHSMFVTASGYEARSTGWAERVLTERADVRERFIVVGFNEFEEEELRQRNDRFYSSWGIKISPASSAEARWFLRFMKARVADLHREAGEKPIEIHIDYSSMPRSWYCNVVLQLADLLRPCDKVGMWYSPGKYQVGEYPTAGINDFRVFAGTPSLNPDRRTHVFGLGFDRVRAQAAWSVLDPQNLVCFYADPAIVEEYAEQSVRDNRELLSTAQYVFTVPLGDFAYAYSKLREIAIEFSECGDVILVPDGPKPLILAASIVPLSLGTPGIVCLHITRPRGNRSGVVAVDAADAEPVGFWFSGRREAAPT